MKTLLAIIAEDGLAALPWAIRIARRSGEPLQVICATQSGQKKLQAVSSLGDDDPTLLHAVLEATHALGNASVVVWDCRAPSQRRVILDAINVLDVGELIIPAHQDESQDPGRSIKKKISRAAPCDVFLVDPCGLQGFPDRVIVPQLKGGGAHALKYAATRFASEGVPVLALPDSERTARSKRVFRRIHDRLDPRLSSGLTQSELSSPTEAALKETIRNGDLVLLDADEAREVPRLANKLAALRAERAEAVFAVGITRAEDAAGPGRFERAAERFRLHAPALTRDQRRDLHRTLEQNGRLSTDFVVMLALSAAIAALGLIQSSASVVIGAMLVAPLMTPLVAIGMALAQGNSRLFRTASRAMLLGILGALLVSMFIGALSPWSDLSAEVVARGEPNVFDLGIALLSGAAASFALARPGLAGTLVGVAIAVALVPPLAAAGIATVKAHYQIALGAAILFSTNLLAIVVGSMLVFRIFGVDASVRGASTPRWVRSVVLLIFVGILATTAVLVQNLELQMHAGVQRAFARPLSPELRDSIQRRVDQHPGVEIVMMAESGIEHGFGLEIVLSSPQPVDGRLVEDLRAIIHRWVGPDHPHRILVLQSAGVIEASGNPGG